MLRSRSFFFFNDTATTEIYTLSLHDALPIFDRHGRQRAGAVADARPGTPVHPAQRAHAGQDRKSTRLNSSHGYISYAVFCLKKKKKAQRAEQLIGTQIAIGACLLGRAIPNTI